jgi:hypothetical protein
MSENGSRIYRWVITTLVGIVCLLVGALVQGERFSKQITINTIEIRMLKENFIAINTKLDRILEKR